MVLHKKTVSFVALFLLLLVISSNYVLYHSSFGLQSLPADLNGVVVGSILDLSLVAPLLFLAWQRKFSVKYFIVLMATGLIAARFIIPSEYLASFQSVMWLGVGIEGILILFELSLLFMLVKNVPPILRRIKSSSLPLLFSFSRAINEKFPKQTFLHVLSSEMLMFYYAFGTWKKKPSTEGNTFTLYKRSSFITFQIMIIHAIVIETLGLHWLLHNTSIILSIVLLILNIYSIVFFLGDIQALRLNPLRVEDDRLYVSFGLSKRMEISFSDIAEIVEDAHILQQKVPNTTIEFIARDFETVHPDLLLILKSPIEATLFMGIKKKYQQVAIRVDDPNALKKIVKERLEKNKQNI
ncbi:beta-carotene 15,15'-monooxygenase [Priestia aryabhattai]|uniref:beta-carotene 15,15'-monooxygenase n=1 Tax=Priestia aryabhattai TaxID=412384 RepID=UPI00245363FB|nr:beta-carotene 15,15'-monooxygenase [Priestia aryabhattai]MDH3113612.1 beta-carotene 15,15'-monooxygenase [Priestia aryabhattai]MDH3127484.1 beta-carotene 15,15'-monooxygenase [Priestia aryabhattai]